MVEIRSRREANLPGVPSSIGHRSMDSWAGIRVHHTGGAFSSWRAVHDWQTAGRPPSQRLAYIGYSFGISDGDVWTLRGWDRHPAHDFINTHLGVVFGGSFDSRLPATRDLDAFVWFVHRAEERAGRKLPISTHRQVGQTTCPGDELHRWVKQALPGRLAGQEDDMMVGLKRGDRGPEVGALQATLNGLGIGDPIGVDNIYGPATAAAVLRMRKWMGSGAKSGDTFSKWAYAQLFHAVGRVQGQRAASAATKQMKAALEAALADLPTAELPRQIVIDLPDEIVVPIAPAGAEEDD